MAGVVARVSELRQAGRPVLIGTRSVAASETLAAHLDAARLSYGLLSARQDRDEAEIIARAGDVGCITVATNMAGRGTDIKLGSSVAESGGLHDRDRAERLGAHRPAALRALRAAGRSRQLRGDPRGRRGPGRVVLSARGGLSRQARPAAAWLGRLVFALAQWRAERAYSRMRRELLDLDDYLGDMLAFSGRGE
jgi:preprotein translocase subunit SecA